MQPALEDRRGSGTLALKQMVARHPMAAFLVMTFTFSWLIVGLAILSEPELGLLPIRLPAELFTALASVFGLALPAFLVTAATGGRSGVRDLLRRSFKGRVGVRWYLLALLGLLLLTLLAALALRGTEPLGDLARNWSLLFTMFLPGVLLAFVFVNLAEEVCWTGFMQHRLQKRVGPLLASVMVAPAFALVHLPAFFVSGWISEERTPFSQLPAVLLQVGLLAVFAIFVRVLITWLYNGSGQSVIIVALFHSAFNMVNGQKLTPQLLGLPEPLESLLPQLAVLLLAVFAASFTRGRLAYKPEPTAVLAPLPLAAPVAPT